VGAQSTGLTLLVLVVLLGCWIGYSAMLESSAWQATLSKRIADLRLYSSEGLRLTFARAAARAFIRDGPFVLLAALPGGPFLSILWLVAHVIVLHRSPVYQAIHDRIAGTWVAAPETTVQLRLS
jgi:uncharacterized RDD family membrane protein YckC